MLEALSLLIVLTAAVAVVFYAWRNLRARDRARQRMESRDPTPRQAPAPIAHPFLRRHRLMAWLAGAAAGVLVYFVLGWSSPFAIAIGLILGLLGSQLESYWAARRTAKIEVQLADAIDLLVGALGAGAGLLNALEHVLSECQRPLLPQLEELVGRIRFGDAPQAAFRGLVERVPLETFQLFSSALAVHWETGGSLAPILANAGRTIRDRIEIGRRVESNVAQSQVSTIAVLGLTYFIALIVWRTNPGQTRLFLSSALGQWLVAATILLQALGIAWMSAISRLRY
jgi:Flp pilus assembly protein TadB